MYSKVLTALAAVLLSTAAIAAQTVPVPVSSPTADPQGYMIGPGDEITGKVLGEEQFDFVATVDANGKIEVPFFDQPIVAQCRTERELRADVAALLKKYLKIPQLSLRVTKRDSRPPVSVYGEVREQQQFILTRRAQLLEIIAKAGGVTEKSGGMIQVFRTRPPMCGEGSPETSWTTASADGLNVPSRLYSLAALRLGSEEANPEILPGDIIVVQKASPIYITGEVVRPGEMSIPEGGLPLTQAVAMASGITREAKSKNIKVYRRKPGATQPEVILAHYDLIKKGQEKDLMLQPFDIVEVDKAKKSISDILLETITGLPGRIPIPIRPL